MKIVLAPNAFKDCMTPYDAAISMEKGIKNFLPKCKTEIVPIADGGDGILDALYIPLRGEKRELEVNGPLFQKIKSEYCYFSKQKFALIEMAKASGLALLKTEERNAARTSSFGTGEILKEALDSGIKHILIGIGGSATNDAGMGILSALGYRFLDEKGNELKPIGENLINVKDIDDCKKNKKIKDTVIDVICDVDNPLYGPQGAAYIYAPQKGADNQMVRMLDEGLKNFSDVVFKKFGVDIAKVPGGGAAGGIGAGLYGVIRAQLKPGIDVVLDVVDMKNKLKDADLVITAEGQIDHQTAFGKAPAGVAKLAKENNVPCIAIAGSIGQNISNLHEIGINSVFSLCPGPISLEKAITNGKELLERATEQVVRCFAAK